MINGTRTRVGPTAALLCVVVASLAMLGAVSCGASSSTAAPDSGPTQQLVARAGRVLLVPSLHTSFGGWCLIEVGAPGCGGVARVGPIIAQSWVTAFGTGGEPGRAIGKLVVAPDVAAIGLPGQQPIPTARPAGLPGALRSVSVEARFPQSEAAKWQAAQSELTTFDSSGRPLPSSAPAPGDLLFTTHPRVWAAPSRPPRGICRIDVARVHGLIVRGGAVITDPRSYHLTIGRPMYACASTQVQTGGTTLLATVLVDAGEPGTSPGPLPGASTARARPGYVEAPGAEGEMLAHRIHAGWVAVQGGTSSQRLRLLSAVQATVHL